MLHPSTAAQYIYPRIRNHTPSCQNPVTEACCALGCLWKRLPPDVAITKKIYNFIQFHREGKEFYSRLGIWQMLTICHRQLGRSSVIPKPVWNGVSGGTRHEIWNSECRALFVEGTRRVHLHVAPCSLVEFHDLFLGELLISFYRTVRRHITEDIALHSHSLIVSIPPCKV